MSDDRGRSGAEHAPIRAFAIALVILLLLRPSPALAATRYYPQTQQSISDPFLTFFDTHGGLPVFGYPRTGEFQLNGRTVQYFQRARLERAGDRVELGLLAVELGRTGEPTTQSDLPSRHFFDPTLQSVGGAFLDFFDANGGVDLFGYPITDEIEERGRTVQYFQRVRLEAHPEQPGQPVQVGLLGDEALALGAVDVPPAAAPRVPPAPPPAVPPALTSPGKLVISAGAGLLFYLASSDGSSVVPVGRGTDPAISPDGSRIAYVVREQPSPGIYVSAVDGTGARPVYAGQDARRPVFSPDGSLIAFDESYACTRVVQAPIPLPPPFTTINKDDRCSRVKVIPADGAAPGQDYLPAGQSAYATSPTWSPDGRRLLFKDEKALFVVDLTDRDAGARQLSQFQPLFFTPDWSPLGGSIAVALDMNRDHSAIALVPDDGRVASTILTPDPPNTDRPFRGAPTNLAPAWARDGRHIAFASDRDGALRAWVMGADGSSPVRLSDLVLTSNNAQERFVSWGG